MSLVEKNQKKEMEKKTIEEGLPMFCEAFNDMGYDRDTKAFLLKKKNEFPYEWLDSYDKLLWPVETMPLKSPVDFKTKLRISTVQEYLLIYLLCDGTQLADVFESFCSHIKLTHKLNPLFFYGAPSLSYNAMLYQFRGDGNVHPVLSE